MKSKIKFAFINLKNQINLRQEILRYIILLFIPLFFCIALYLSVQKITYAQLLSNAEHTVNQFHLQMSSMMRETELINSALCSDLISINNHNESMSSLPYNYDTPSSICQQIAIRISASKYINHIYFISEETRKIYSEDGYFNYSSLKSILKELEINYDHFFEITETEWNMIADSHLCNPYCITPLRDAEGIINGYLLISLNLDVFINAAFDLNTSFACLYNEKTFITSQPIGKKYSVADLTSEKSVSKLLGKLVKCFHINIDDFTYMIAIDKSSYYYPFTYISNCFIAYAAIIFTLGFAYLYKVSKERYRDFSKLIDALPQKDTLLTYKNLIPTVQTALLDSQNQSKTYHQIVSENIFHNILYGHYDSATLKDRFEDIGIPSENITYYIAVFYIKSFNNVTLISSDTGDVNHMIRIIFQTAVEQFTDSSFHTFSCSEADSFITMFYSSSEEHLNLHVMAACESINKFLNDGYGILLHTTISSAATDLQEVTYSFNQAVNLEKYSIAIDSKSKIICEDILHDNGELLLRGDFFRQEQTLLNTLLMGKYSTVPSMVKSILQEHVVPLTSDYTLAHSRLKAISNILVGALFYVQYPIDVDAFVKRLQFADSVSALTMETTEIYTHLAKMTVQAPLSYKEVDAACEYITDHLEDQNLNVSMICEAVGIIVQRLTPMFQEQLNMGIAEYVNYRRIEKSKILLSTTKLTIKQIAVEVGYSTTDTFTRNLRKLENLTPTEYRKIL